MLYRAGKLDKHAPDLADIEGELSALIQGWRNIYPDEQPTQARKRPARAGWQPQPYRVYDADHAGGVWELGGYTRGITGAVEDRNRYGMTIDLTHLPTGFLYGHADTWELATILADTIATALPGGTFTEMPAREDLAASRDAVQAARAAYADQLAAKRAARDAALAELVPAA
jgi:hypothetical protein